MSKYPFKPRALRSLALALILASLPGLAQSQTPLSKSQRLDLAEAFLESPDSGVWTGPDDTFENVTAVISLSPNMVARYHRYHRGLRLSGASVKVLVTPSGEVSFSFPPEPFVPPANLTPAIRESDARAIAAREMDVDVSGLSGDFELALLVEEEAPEALLIWDVQAFHPDAAPLELEIDAQSGEVIYREAGVIEESAAKGTGSMRPKETDGPPQGVELDTLWKEGRYYMKDPTRGGTSVRDLQDSAPIGMSQGEVYVQDVNDWGNGEDWLPGIPTDGKTGQTAAVEALWGAQRTWDMFLNALGLEGYDDIGKAYHLRVHYRLEIKKPYGDANFDGTFANFGSQDAGEGRWSRTELSTVGHELAHGIWRYNVAKKNKNEAKGLNEGHADIAGTLAVHYARLANGEGGHIPTHERGNLEHFIQRMVNPWSYSIPGCEAGLAAYINGMKHYEEHCQGTAYGHMFAMLAMGVPSQPEVDAAPCTGKRFSCLGYASYPYGVAGIGMDKAARIWIVATLYYFDNDPTFWDARQAWLKAAKELYGEPSPEYSAVQNAFHMINLGPPAEDMFPPEITADPPIVDNDEGTVLLEVTGQDDIGVVAVDVATLAESKRFFGSRFKGYLEVSSIPGPQEATAQVWDWTGQGSPEIPLPFDYESANRLFLSKFESSDHVVDLGAGVDHWSRKAGSSRAAR